MSPAAIFDSFFAHQGAFVGLLDAALRSLLVACVVWAGLRLLGARHVVAQKIAWSLVLAGALLMPLAVPWASSIAWLPAQATLVLPANTFHNPILKSETPRINNAPHARPNPAFHVVARPAAAQPKSLRQTNRMDESRLNRFPAPAAINSYSAGFRSGDPPPTPTLTMPPLADCAFLLYGFVSLALLLRLFYGLGASIILWRSAQPVRIDSPLGAGLRLRASPGISSPVTIGSGVLLPADYTQWDHRKLRIVLAHERSHVRQADFYLQALAGLYTALFWFSPLGWWLRRKLSDLSEAISDRAGLVEAASHASYAQILLEFAALPRRTQIGVAMASKGRLSQRIERLLNENSFRQAFAGGRGRLLAALLLVPIALFAATALIRVQAAHTLQQPAAAHGPLVTPIHPPGAAVAAVQAPAAPPAPASVPSPSTQPISPAAPEAPPPALAAPAPEAAPAPPPPAEPDIDGDEQDQADTTTQSLTTNSNHNFHRHVSRFSTGRGFAFSTSSDGESYALVSGKDAHLEGNGSFNSLSSASIEKARAMAHGDFLWFTRNGKSYVVDDPQIIAQAEAMYKPIEDLGRQQEELGRQQEELGRQQEELGRQQEQATVSAPDISKEMASLNASVAKLQAMKNAKITMDQLADLQEKIGDLQGKLGELQGEVGAHQGELGTQQGKLGAQQGKLGAQQGRLGAEQGRRSREADQKVKSIIDESLKNGKARPVQ